MYRDYRWLAQDAEQERDDAGRFAAGSGNGKGTFTQAQKYPHEKKLSQGYKHVGQLHSGEHVYVHPQRPNAETHVSTGGFNSSHKKGGEHASLVIGGRGSKGY